VVDLSAVDSKAGLLDVLASGLDFPGWVGRNWDALDDALRDLSWWPPGTRGRVLLIRGAERAAAHAPGAARVLGEVFEHAADRWATTGTPLVVLLRR
jgi:hypothetical protein